MVLSIGDWTLKAKPVGSDKDTASRSPKIMPVKHASYRPTNMEFYV